MARIAITNAEIDPDSPITTGLMTKYRDNEAWTYEGVERSWAFKTANDPLNNDNTVNADADLVLAGTGGTTVVFDGAIYLTVTVNNGFKYHITTSDAANDVGYVFSSQPGRIGAVGDAMYAGASVINADVDLALPAAPGTMLIYIKGWITFDATPAVSSVTFSWSQSAVHVDFTTLHIGSYFWLTRVDQW